MHVSDRVRLTNALGAEIKGTLYNADPVSKVVIINSRSPPPNPSTNPSSVPGDYHIVPISAIQSFSVQAGGNSDYMKQTAPTRIDRNFLEKRLETRVEQVKAERQHIGQGVSEDGQRLYDALRKLNTPVRWHGNAAKGTHMIISEAVILDAPFESANCRAAADKQDILQRTKRMVDDQRKKLGLSGGVRKGG